MQTPMRPIALMSVVVALVLAGGCGEGESANETPVGPDVSGEWSGTYHIGSGPATPMEASVSQNGRAFFMETTLPDSGRLITGEINGGGGIIGTDAFDGETWTAGEPATPNRLVLIDFASGPGSALRTIDLSR